ncbi:MAG: hypothetical protein M1821_005962 [Bathelium mastoideum]|nr:MAG: hypothetical protein M1821_005962 [Bathelium mastoideum]
MEQRPGAAVDQSSDTTGSPATIEASAPEQGEHNVADACALEAGAGSLDLAYDDGYASGDSESTPRSEVPSSADNGNNSFPQPSQVTEEQGYFAPRPLPYHTHANQSTGSISSQPAQSQSVPPPSILAESVASGALGITRPSSTCFDHHGRPTVQRDLSSTSTASTATVTAASYDPASFPTVSHKRPRQDYPQYPNQAYAALQSQLHPSPHPPPPLRARSAHPSDYTSFSAAATPLHHPQARLVTEPGSKTAGNSPAGSPGLFTPTPSPIRSNVQQFDDDGSYTTPYLHYTHRQAPKETHVADVDVDPISGRKIINEYEILDELGRGAHGKVKLGRSLTTSTFVAIKIVERYAKKRRLGKLGNAEDKVKKEVAILKKARHPNIVALLEVIDDPARKKVYIVLEWVQRGEITWRVRCPKALALLEARRYERESEGIVDDEVAEAEDEAIWEVSEGRRHQVERRQLTQSRRRNVKGSGHESWSLEYGGQLEEDDWDGATLGSSAPPEATTGKARKASREASASDIFKTITQGSVDAENRAGTVTGNADSAMLEHSMTERPSVMNTPTGLEGTMYGAYETESPSHWHHHGHLGVSEANGPARFHRHFDQRNGAQQTSSPEELLDADLHDDLIYVPCLSFQAARVAFRDTVLGIEYLHYQSIIHRDIKPPNLLQTVDHHIKISDFGVSYLGRPVHDDHADDSESDAQDVKFDEARELAKTVGTAAFYAPELCHTDPTVESPPVTAQIDVWALGVTLFCLIFARTPFVDNEFVIMKNIAEREIYVPTKRLKPIDAEASSRPSSQGRITPIFNSRKRKEYERAYEDLDEDLYNLLKRLFIKDPNERITLAEVKHHPWVLRDIADPRAWLEETDPSRHSEGKKIEITKEEMNEAVVPLNIIERMRSGFRKLGGALGLGSSKATASTNRKRTKSNAANADAGLSSATSSSSTLSQEGRRPSLRGDELSFTGFRLPREGEHPLSQSLTASLQNKETGAASFASLRDRPASPAGTITKKDSDPYHHDISRAEQHEGRAHSPFRQASSMRNFRPADVAKMVIPKANSTPPPPASAGLPGTPHSLETPGTTGLSGLFGGASRRMFRSSRTRDKSPSSASGSSRAASVERSSEPHDDPHSTPSIALSNDFAAGRLDPPALLKEGSSGSLSTSPSAFRAHALVHSGNTPGRYRGESNSPGRGFPRDRPGLVGQNRRLSQDLNLQLARSVPALSEQNASPETRSYCAPEDWRRRQQTEMHESRDRPSTSQQHRWSSSASYVPCPPSPDDEVFYSRQQEEEALRLQTTQHVPSLEASPTGSSSNLQQIAMTPSSSEDQLTSAMSQSTSNPSIPSVASADSSIVPDEGYSLAGQQKASPVPDLAAPVPFRPQRQEQEYDDGYAGDHALESNEDEDESDSDEDGAFLEMTRKRAAVPDPLFGERFFGTAHLRQQ